MNFAPNGHLKGLLGIGKAQLILLVEAILRPFWDYDELEYKKPNHSSSSSKGGEFGWELDCDCTVLHTCGERLFCGEEAHFSFGKVGRP